MRPNRIDTIESYNGITEKYGDGCKHSNVYLQSRAKSLISVGKLYVVGTESNAFLYAKEPVCYRMYYYLNDFEEPISLPDVDTVVEVLFRGNLGIPREEVDFLKGNGFKENLVRDQYTAVYKNINKKPSPEGITVRYADNIEEVERACELFNESFDKFSGDMIPSEDYRRLYEERDILIANSDKDEFLGAGHFSIKGKISELRHLAVNEEARGKGVGSAILNAYISQSHNMGIGRFSLWVQQQNTIAVSMYEKAGFRYCNKSTLSMIKSKQDEKNIGTSERGASRY